MTWKERLDRMQKANKKLMDRDKRRGGGYYNSHSDILSPRGTDRMNTKCDFCGKQTANRNANKSQHGQVFCNTCTKWKRGRQYQ